MKNLLENKDGDINNIAYIVSLHEYVNMITTIAIHIKSDFNIMARDVDNPSWTAWVSVDNLDTTKI